MELDTVGLLTFTEIGDPLHTVQCRLLSGSLLSTSVADR